jgi:hypothetical protein
VLRPPAASLDSDERNLFGSTVDPKGATTPSFECSSEVD